MNRSARSTCTLATAAALALLPVAAAPSFAVESEEPPGDTIEIVDPSWSSQDSHRVAAYYQTIYENDGQDYVDPRPLTPYVTDVQLGAIHMHDDGSIWINDHEPDDPQYDQMWDHLAEMQSAGVRVSPFVGGAAQGTYERIEQDYDTYYPVLRDFLAEYNVDGVDLDIEEPFSFDVTVQLIEDLRADFGEDFIITLTPVAADMAGHTDFSGGFDYAELEETIGHEIDWYMVQFYCGWGTVYDEEETDPLTWYQQVLDNGFTPDRFVAGTVTADYFCPGYVDPENREEALTTLTDQHTDFGGVFGWEYYGANTDYEDMDRVDWFADVHDLVRQPTIEIPAEVNVTVEPAEVAPGETVLVTAEDLAPWEEVEIALNPSMGTVTADETGGLTAEVTIPEDTEPGDYSVNLTGLTHGQQGQADLTTVETEPSPAPSEPESPTPTATESQAPSASASPTMTQTTSPTEQPTESASATDTAAPIDSAAPSGEETVAVDEDRLATTGITLGWLAAAAGAVLVLGTAIISIMVVRNRRAE